MHVEAQERGLRLAVTFAQGGRDLFAETGQVGATELAALGGRRTDRIDPSAVAQHLEMEMGAGRTAGAAGEAYELAAHPREPASMPGAKRWRWPYTVVSQSA